MERWQRRAERALARFTGPIAPGGGRGLIAFGDTAVPIVVMGEDRSDAERSAFMLAFQQTAGGAGFVNTLTLQAQLGDVEILAAWAGSLSAGLRINASLSQFGVPAALSSQPQQTAEGSSFATVVAATVGGGGLPVHFHAPVDVLLELPFAGFVLERGRQLQLTQTVDNQGLIGGFAWRNLLGATER